MNHIMVSNVEPFDKKRLRITFEDSTTFVLYLSEARRYNLNEGANLSEDALQDIKVNIILKRAKARALHLLEKRRYTERKLREKLLSGGYDRDTVDKALDYVKSYNYVDDTSYAYDFIEAGIATKSKEQLKQKLFIRGIPADIFEEAYAAFSQDNQVPDESDLIRGLMDKKGYDPSNANLRERQRMYAFLQRRGFSSEAIARELLA